MTTRLVIFFLFTCACLSTHAQVNIITTIAGKAGVPASYYGDGVPATAARFYAPFAICYDGMSDVFISDANNSRVRKIDLTSGIITTVAGTSTVGYSGDGGPATDAMLSSPQSIKIDSSGNIYIADGENNRLRKISGATGIITTVCGTGLSGDSGDGGPATSAKMHGPVGLCLDKLGNVYFADYYNNRVRKIDFSTGLITAFAGTGATGYTGDNGLAINATFSSAVGVFADSSDNIFICDQYNHAVRRVDAITGIITTIVGTGTAGYTGDNGPATGAKLNEPASGTVDKQGNIYIADFRNGAVRKIDAATGIITTVAGNGTWGWAGDGGPPTAAELSCTDIALDEYGQMYIADYGTNTIRKVYNPKLEVHGTKRYETQMSIYPNPTQNEVTVAYSLDKDADLHVCDIAGRMLTEQRLSSKKSTAVIDFRAFAKGIYFYKVTQEGLIISTGKVVKE